MDSSPHFFKIILQNSLRDRKLVLPKKFIRNYGGFLSDSVCLKLPNGEDWTVKLTTVDGMVWLENGWHEFAEHYSLEFGSLLVFRYDLMSIFHTMIFDPAGLEIEYPSKDSEEHESKVAEEDKDDDSVEILDASSRHPKKRERESLPCCCHQSCKKMRNAYSKMPKWEPEARWETGADMPNSERKAEDRVRRRREPLSSFEKAEDIKKFSVSKSLNPSFILVMRRANVQGKFSVMLPKKFAKEYLSKSGGIATIQDSDGQVWTISYKWAQGRYPYISKGWVKVARANSLKEKDVCTLELIEKDTFLLTKEQNSFPQPGYEYALDKRHGSQQASSSRSLKASEARNKFVPKKPFFIIDVRSKSFKSGSVNIPHCFARDHLSLQTQTMKLHFRNKQWELKLKRKKCYLRFSAGWRAFYKDNSLADGDKCVFEMMRKEDSTFRVTIIKSKE